MSNFLTLVQQLQREVGVAGSPITTVLNHTGMYSKLVNWIADADVHVQALKTDWKFLWTEYSVSTIIGIPDPTVPSDLNVWDRDSFYLDYTLASNRKLNYLDYKLWRDALGRGVQINHKPSQIVIKPNNQIILHSVPDAVYALTGEYWVKPTKMVADGDASVIPVNYERVIILQAKLWYAEEQEMPDVYKSAYNEMYGDPQAKKDIGLLGRLKANQLPGQEGRTMGESPNITVRPE